ncbi:MAG TPA: AAA family ATPase [Sphingomicrobium sp.]
MPWKRSSNARNREPAPIDQPPLAPTQLAERRPVVIDKGRSILLPRFHTTAADHLGQDQRDSFGRQRLRVRSAFTPAQPVVDPRMFAGRTEQLEMMIRSVEDQRLHVVVFGDRGVGKTSLLHMMTMAAREARYIVAYVSCGALSEFDETFRTVAAEVPLLFHSGVSPVSSSTETGSSLADLLPEGRLSPRQFGDAAAKLVGTRLLIVLDEFDRAESAEFRRDISELIKILSDLSARVQLVIAGVAGDLADLVGFVPSIRRSISALRISAMTDEEVQELIGNGERTSGLTFEREATAMVISAVHGSPYLSSLICHLAGMQALEQRRSKVTAEDVSGALNKAVEDLRSRLPTDLLPHLDRFIASGQAATAPTAPRRGNNATMAKVTSRGAWALEQLHRSGLLGAGDPRYALIADAVTPYIQLMEALRYRVPANAEPDRVAE